MVTATGTLLLPIQVGQVTPASCDQFVASRISSKYTSPMLPLLAPTLSRIRVIWSMPVPSVWLTSQLVGSSAGKLAVGRLKALAWSVWVWKSYLPSTRYTLPVWASAPPPNGSKSYADHQVLPPAAMPRVCQLLPLALPRKAFSVVPFMRLNPAHLLEPKYW